MALLQEQPPPRKGAKAGYYPDPLGSGRGRYWDGHTWTAMVGGRVAQDAAGGKALPPPTKVCRHCGAQSETFAVNCPNCGKSYSKQSTGAIIAIIAAACLGVLVLFAGCGLFVAVVVNEVDDELDRTSITREQFDSVEIGTTQAEVEGRLGKPFDRDRFRGQQCIDYHDDDASAFDLDTFRFCFAEGFLVAKRDTDAD